MAARGKKAGTGADDPAERRRKAFEAILELRKKMPALFRKARQEGRP